MTKKVPVRRQHRNASTHHQPDLFLWESTPPRHDNRAVSIIARRFGLSVEHAITVARLAGVGGVHHEA